MKGEFWNDSKSTELHWRQQRKNKSAENLDQEFWERKLKKEEK